MRRAAPSSAGDVAGVNVLVAGIARRQASASASPHTLLCADVLRQHQNAQRSVWCLWRKITRAACRLVAHQQHKHQVCFAACRKSSSTLK